MRSALFSFEVMAELEQAPLPIVLWSFGLLNLLQYQEVLEWQRRPGQL